MNTNVEKLSLDAQFSQNFSNVCAANAVQGRRLASSFYVPTNNTVILLFVA